MPLLSTPFSTAGLDAAEPADGVDRPQVVLVALLGRQAAVERDAQAGAVERLLDVVRGQGVAGEEHVEVAEADQLRRCARRCRCGRRPGRARRGSSRPPPCVRRMAAAISRTVTPLGFSLETGLAMNSNRFCRGRRLGREDAQPLPADDDPVALAHVGHRHAAGRLAFGIEEDAAVHLLVLDLDPFAVEPDLGAVVGGAVEALGKGAVHVGELRAGSPAASTGTAPWSWMASRMSSSCSAVAARTSMRA